VRAAIDAKAARQGRSKSSVEAEILCRALGYDYATGTRLERARRKLGTVVAFRVKGGKA
jgi:hypothetical protein